MSEVNRFAPPYTVADLTAVAGFEPRTLELLIRERVAPGPIGRGRRGALLYGDQAVATMALAGVLYRVALDPVPAARIAKAIAEISHRGHVQERLDDAWRAAVRAVGADGISVSPPDPETAPLDRYQLHRGLVVGWPEYSPAKPTKSDLHLEIVNRAYLFVGVPGGLRQHPAWPGGAVSDMTPEARILGWHRGGEVTVQSMFDEIPAAWADGDEAALAVARAVEAEFMSARSNAAAKIMVNISLAVRQGFLKLDEHRNQRGVEGERK